MENYICINGKKAELTEEQLKALGIELPKASPFERVINNANTFYDYYFINSTGSVDSTYDGGFCNGNGTDDLRYRTANYCTDKSIMEQRALHETLNRLLWRYSMEHDGDKINMCDNSNFRYGVKRKNNRTWTTFPTNAQLFGCPMFDTEEIAQNAINEIVLPFMEAHPEFEL